jgi:hypothetical protein
VIAVTRRLTKTAVPTAVVPPAGGAEKVTVGREVYPFPGFVTVALATERPVKVAVAAAPEPPVPVLVKTTVGADV